MTKRDMNRVHLACKRLYALGADIIGTKYEASASYVQQPCRDHHLREKCREIYKNLRAAGHHPSFRSHKGKVFRVNEFLKTGGVGRNARKILARQPVFVVDSGHGVAGGGRSDREIPVFCMSARINARARTKSSIFHR